MKRFPNTNPKYLITTGRDIIPAPKIVFPIWRKAPQNDVFPLEYFGFKVSSSVNISSFDSGDDIFSLLFSFLFIIYFYSNNYLVAKLLIIKEIKFK